MTTVLYITAHPLNDAESSTLQTGAAFVEAYRTANPSHEVVHIDLYRSNLPQLDEEILQGWSLLQKGESFDQLSSSTQMKIARLGELVEQFISADKYIFASPVWNLSYPPSMKAYIDAIFVSGKTFNYTSEGPVGLLRDQGKKAIHIQSSGSVYSTGPAAALNFGHHHLYATLQFFGVETLEPIYIEGLAQSSNDTGATKLAAAEQAAKVAAGF